MAVQGGEDAYFTLLLSDSYLPGALVLAHSLRDAGTTKELAVMVTLDTISAEAITQLKTVYDHVIPVPRIRNERPANLYLMNRPDLHSAFTKINLWKQTQFRKIVYVDADVVAYRAPDELFDIKHAFSAAPDIGWPDLFNTGVMVLSPNMGDYYAMMAMAGRGISFDGADQGLLNMHFKNSYNRLPFTYNVTPSAHYQYVPAYRHFQSSINMVHFIGSEKPWLQGRDASTGSGPFDEMFGRWWAVYDRHYRADSVAASKSHRPPSELVQYFVKGEYQPRISYVIPIGDPSSQSQEEHQHQQQQQQQQQHPIFTSGQQYHEHQHYAPPPESTPHVHHEQYHEHQQHHQQAQHQPQHHHHHEEQGYQEPQAKEEHHYHYPQTETIQEEHHDRQPLHYHHEPPSHDRSQHHHHHHHSPHAPHSEAPHFEGHPVPPANPSFSSVVSSSFSTSEGPNTEARPDQIQGHQQWAPTTTHQEHKQEEHKPPPPPMEPSWDAQRQPPPAQSKPEALNFPQMHYDMSSDTAPFVPPERYPSPPKNMWYEVPKEPPAPPRQEPPQIFPWEDHRPQPSRVFADESPPPEHHIATEGSSITGLSGQFWEHKHHDHHDHHDHHHHEHHHPQQHHHQHHHGDAAPHARNEGRAPAEQSYAFTVSTATEHNEPVTPTTPLMALQTADPWSSFTLTNAWDDIPEIERYVDSLQPKHRRGKGSLGSGGSRGGSLRLTGLGPSQNLQDELASGFRRRGSRLTDFPSEAERPSLPVTPAPIRGPKFWGGSGGGSGRGGGDSAAAAASWEGHGESGGGGGYGEQQQMFPVARGVPAQSDWDPVARLQMLAQQQSELLLQRLGGAEGYESGGGGGGGEEEEEARAEGEGAGAGAGAPPSGEETMSPMYVAHSTTVLSPKPVKPPGSGISPVRSIMGDEDEAAGAAAVPRSVAGPSSSSMMIQEPSYLGPGPSWEKGEGVPLRETTPVPPTEEDKDVLET